jgi:hypothetical protein
MSIDLDNPDNDFTTEQDDAIDGNDENEENQEADDGKLENSFFKVCFLNVFLLFI